MKILVTGSSGSIGTRVCEELIATGHEVVGADWKPNQWNTEVDKLTINVDLRDEAKTAAALSVDIDMVIHLAANARVYNLIQDPFLARDNFDTLFSVLEFVRKNDVKKFIFASSREVYGNATSTSCKEEDANFSNSESPYTASKVGGEAVVHAYHRCYGVPFVILRFANVYGLYDDSDRVVPLFIKKCARGEDLSVFGEGKTLDFTHSDDIATGVLSAIEKFDEVKNETFNISYGVGTTIVDLAKLIATEMETDNKVQIEENRAGEVINSVIDITKAKERLHFKPSVPIEPGIKKTIAWYKANLL